MRVLGLLLAGCAVPALPPAPDQVSWPEVDAVLQESCVRCHERGATMYAGVDLSTYAAARSARIRSVCTAVTEAVVREHADALHSAATPDLAPCPGWELASMPPGATPRLSLEDQVLLARWVELGAPEGT